MARKKKFNSEGGGDAGRKTKIRSNAALVHELGAVREGLRPKTPHPLNRPKPVKTPKIRDFQSVQKILKPSYITNNVPNMPNTSLVAPICGAVVAKLAF